MNLRLAIFVVTMLLLPLLASLLTGVDWGDDTATTYIPAQMLLLTTLLLVGYVLLANRLATLRGGANLLSVPRRYQAYIVAGSVGLGWLALFLNHYADTGFALRLEAATVVAVSALFAVLMPAVLATRAWLTTFPALLRLCARHAPAIPAPKPEPMALWLLTLTIVGLMGGVARPQLLGALLWSSPLWLLLALQLLWHEHTLFSGLPRGDWQRPLLAALSGLLVGMLALACFAASGSGMGEIGAASWGGCALFGLVVAQLNELIASGWRGKTRGEIVKRKAFPIPVVVKKD